jgi:hypothetical protein
LTEGITHSLRTALRWSAAGAFALTIAVSVWLLVTSPRGKTADCATAQQMWTYYQSQLASARSAALKSNGDNDATTLKYQTMLNELQAYANRVTTPDIRSRTDRIVAINRDMFEQWKRWVAQSQAPSPDPATPSSSDKQFGNQFAASARKLKLVHAELEAACST